MGRRNFIRTMTGLVGSGVASKSIESIAVEDNSEVIKYLESSTYHVNFNNKENQTVRLQVGSDGNLWMKSNGSWKKVGK
jgi:hypothetical protein